MFYVKGVGCIFVVRFLELDENPLFAVPFRVLGWRRRVDSRLAILLAIRLVPSESGL